MKKLAKIGFVILVIIIYIFSINLFASLINFSSTQQSIKSIISGGLSIVVSMSDSVGIVVTKERFYGTIIETNGEAYLYLFNLVKLPHKIQSYNFIIFHLIFLITLILFTILIFTKKKVYKEEEPNLEHENLAENYLNNP